MMLTIGSDPSTVVTTASQTHNWRNKYFDSLGKLEQEQEKFRATEAALKLIARRLCAAALGQSPALDAQIRRLQDLLRREATTEELDRITPALTDAIHSLDRPQAPVSGTPPAAPVAPSMAGQVESIVDADIDERVRSILASLFDELRRDTELLDRIATLDAKLTPASTHDDLLDVLSSTVDIVAIRIQRIEDAKLEMEGLLSHMVSKLDEVSKFVAEQNHSQSESHASTQTLNAQLAGEIKAMGESVDRANDLPQLRAQVRDRLDSIDSHLRQFRERESTLAAAAHTRTEQMSARIAELEAETSKLHRRLKDEQHLAMLDALTRIPNRLAYEKWIAEELKRSQRFGHPTCLAVWDVDHFKRVNDTYGHRAGDRVLRAVADCLKARVRGTDFLARYGGEEFVMILPGTTLEDALRVLDEIRGAITTISFHFRGTPVPITLSCGVTAFHPTDSLSSVFDRADQALYRAKQAGRNRCELG